MLDLILPILTVGLVFGIGLGVMVFALARLAMPVEGTLRDRLMQYESENQPKPVHLEIAHQILSALTFALKPYTRQVYGKNKNFLTDIRQTLMYAGLPANDDVIWQRLAQQMVVGGALALIGLGLGVWWTTLNGDEGNAFLINAVGGMAFLGLLGMKVPMMKLKRKASARQMEIYYALPDVLDLMVICMEAGLALDAAMQRVSKEVEPITPDIGQELKRIQGEIGAGIPRATAFNHMSERTSVEEFKSLCTMIIQADKMGTSISQALRVYAEDIRTKRRQKAEELAHKAAIKMMFPLVIFIFPALLTVILGPGLIQIYETWAGLG